MNKKTTISASDDIISNLRVLAREKEEVRRKLAVTATKLAITAQKLASTAKEKEYNRRKLAVTAKQLAVTAREVVVSNKYARSLIEASLDPLVTISPKGKITDVNEATIKVTGVSRQNLIGTDFSKYFTEPKKALAGYKKVFRDGSVTDYPLTIRSRLGKLTDVLYNASVYKDDKGTVLGVFAAARDYTRAKKATELLATTAKKLAVTAKEKEEVRRKVVVTAKKLKKSHETLEIKVLERTRSLEIVGAKERALLLSIGNGLIATDERGNIILINKTAEKILGNKKDELIGKKFSKIVLFKDEKGSPIQLDEHPVSMALRDGVTTTGSTYYNARGDKKIPVSVTVTPVLLGGKVIGTIKVFRDITNELAVDKAKTEFVSLASHQLRTPLSTVNWYAEMLLAGDVGELNKKQKKYLEEVYRSNQRMVELVNALLDVSRLELGTFVIDPESTDICKLARDVINEQRPEIDEKKIRFALECDRKILLMQADPKLLRMVMQNILSNSVKYIPKSGKIKLSIRLSGSKNIQIKISDTGYGIPRDQHNKIFTKLFRADNVREKDTDGTGLGLYIVKSIVENSGGKIWFKSKENVGTTFYVNLPIHGMNKESILNNK